MFVQVKEKLKFVIVIWGEPSKDCASKLDCPVFSFDEVLAKAGNRTVKPVPVRDDDLATLVFTSGTTGAPKVIPLLWFWFKPKAGGWGWEGNLH